MKNQHMLIEVDNFLRAATIRATLYPFFCGGSLSFIPLLATTHTIIIGGISI
jgi:hypothetical protein